ncbi:hypothetical protein TVAG_429770 [Trichomonas vaginalis G3]|uniref:DUF3447 domain-containing protein n=1 Tax=Trichomonas vaginalis (strain ATCC PRA-98 / G3) TaxID=412133 RepID=A2FKN7_TRIV3|nr:ankyrin repeat and SOCS box-containing protein 4 family [Trichomonas vaginalis G3]EAX94535.1 hypothetical protein TVAG_429770 [Trichomonas vaginalis G3]KAI5534851.1 ankyrin repeat and SOCS box-containing protein 4 family [Trichomonas vaginalis G3]|eukprot:XP_001307465.1 hypothetical protein [Trichomonas vaginalis G3]
MSDQDIHTDKYSELRSSHKCYIDIYNALYQLKTENEGELNSIYNLIKKELINSKKDLPQSVMEEILDIIKFNNRYTMSYLFLAKLIFDEYHLEAVTNNRLITDILLYQELGIKLGISIPEYLDFHTENFDIHTENTIYRTIIYNDLKRFISLTEIEGFSEYQKLDSKLYPFIPQGLSLLELCCYHGAVDCFKFLRTKFNSEITQKCLEFSFLGGNPEIMSECLKHKKPDRFCMENAIISHNIDFVTFLMNEYNIKIDLTDCVIYNNLDAFLVYIDQINDINQCFIYSWDFNIPSLLDYFIIHGANINEKDEEGNTALHIAALYNSKETAELLISHGANINEKDSEESTALHSAACNCKEVAELLISHGANINEKEEFGNTALHIAAQYNSKETAELLISHGININEKDKDGNTALHIAAQYNSKETAELLISYGAIINEKDKDGKTALHYTAKHNSKETAEVLISHDANINEKDNNGKTALHYANSFFNKEMAELLISHGANID